MRKLLFVMVMLGGIILTGCARQVDLSEEQNDIIAEYMANTVLKYEENYKEALIYPEETVPEETADGLETDTGDNTASGPENEAAAETGEDGKDALEQVDYTGNGENKVSVSNMNLSEEMGKGKFKISYQGYILCESYPKDSKKDYFSIGSAKGNHLLVISFDVKNLSDKKENLNLIGSGFGYSLENGSGNTYKPKLTLLVNDIQYINIEIPGGKTQEAIIVFEIPKDTDMSATNLVVTNNEKTAGIGLEK